MGLVRTTDPGNGRSCRKSAGPRLPPNLSGDIGKRLPRPRTTRLGGTPTWSYVRSLRRGTESASANIPPERLVMAKAKADASSRQVEEWMAKKSGILTKAQALTTMGLLETAQPLWASA